LRIEPIELFEVPDIAFESPAHFRQYLATEFKPAEILHNLTVIGGITELDQEALEAFLERSGFTFVRRYGALARIAKRSREGLFESYVSYDRESVGVILFYSNFRKTEELRLVYEFLESAPKTYRLFLRPLWIDGILRNLLSNNDHLRILDFTASRSFNSATPARLRPRVGRTLRYWGPDGREVLGELSNAYGVVPKKLRVEIPGASTFSIDNTGSFTLFSGEIKILLEIIKSAIESAVSEAATLKKAHFQLYPVAIPGEDFQVAISSPADIALEIKLDYTQALSLLEQLEEEDFVPYNTTAEEGSVFLRSDILDLRTSEVFRLRADEKRLRILPGSPESVKSLLRFYEFVLEQLDARAELLA